MVQSELVMALTYHPPEKHKQSILDACRRLACVEACRSGPHRLQQHCPTPQGLQLQCRLQSASKAGGRSHFTTLIESDSQVAEASAFIQLMDEKLAPALRSRLDQLKFMDQLDISGIFSGSTQRTRWR